MERKLAVTSGRKNVVGRPILYRTSRDFLVHFGLKDIGELPSLREFEELARQALGSELMAPASEAASAQTSTPAAESLSAEHSRIESSPETPDGSSNPKPHSDS